MKPLIIILFIAALCSCNNNSTQAKIYEDSANYFSDKLAAVTDSGYSGYDSIDIPRKTSKQIYEIKRKYYIDKMKGKH